MIRALPAHAVLGVLHVALAAALALALVDAPGPIPSVLIPVLSAAMLLANLPYGPCIGLGIVSILLHQSVDAGLVARRLDGGAVLVLGVLVPLYLSSGFRASAARRPFGAASPSPRPFAADDLVHLATLPFAVLGLALPLAALLRRAVGVRPFWDLPFPESSAVFLFLWGAVLAVVAIGGAATLARFRRLRPLEARIHLLECARDLTAADEAAIWRRLARYRRKRSRRTP